MLIGYPMSFIIFDSGKKYIYLKFTIYRDMEKGRKTVCLD